MLKDLIETVLKQGHKMRFTTVKDRWETEYIILEPFISNKKRAFYYYDTILVKGERYGIASHTMVNMYNHPKHGMVGSLDLWVDDLDRIRSEYTDSSQSTDNSWTKTSKLHIDKDSPHKELLTVDKNHLWTCKFLTGRKSIIALADQISSEYVAEDNSHLIKYEVDLESALKKYHECFSSNGEDGIIKEVIEEILPTLAEKNSVKVTALPQEGGDRSASAASEQNEETGHSSDSKEANIFRHHSGNTGTDTSSLNL